VNKDWIRTLVHARSYLGSEPALAGFKREASAPAGPSGHVPAVAQVKH